MHDYDLLVVGSANADLVIGVDRRPAAGETVLGSDLAVHPGGKGANQAVAAARLGARTALLARVGDDAHGRLLLDSQRAAGVDTVGVLVGGAPTGVALITVDPSGDNSIVVSPGANARLTPADVPGAREPAGRRPGGLAAAGDPAGDGRRGGARRPTRAGTPVSCCNPSPPAPAARRGARRLRPARGQRARGARPAGRPRPGDTPRGVGAGAAGARPALGGGHAGRRGRARRRRRDGTVACPARGCEAVDTTGAGDAFTGALAWRLGAGDDLETACGSRCGSARPPSPGPGAQESFPTAEEVAAL